METRANDRDLIGSYRTADPQGRLEIVFANYHIFPKDAKAKYKIGKSALYNVEKIDEYLEHFLEEE